MFNHYMPFHRPAPWATPEDPAKKWSLLMESDPDWDVVKQWKANNEPLWDNRIIAFLDNYAPEDYVPSKATVTFGNDFISEYYYEHSNSRIKIPASYLTELQDPSKRFEVYRDWVYYHLATHKEEIDAAAEKEASYKAMIAPTKLKTITETGKEIHDTQDSNTRTDNLADSSTDVIGGTTTQHYYEGVDYNVQPLGRLQAYESPTDKYSSRTDTHNGTNTGTQKNVGSGKDTLSFQDRVTTIEEFNESYAALAGMDKDFEGPLQIITRLLDDTLYRVKVM